MWIKLNTTQATEKIEIYGSDKKSTNTNTKKLCEEPSSVEGKTIRQIRSIHYNKIEIITLKLHPKFEFTMNWENTIIPLETNTTSPQRPIARSFTLNTSILCNCSTWIIILEKNPNLSSLCVLSKRKITFYFSLSAAQRIILFPSIGFKIVFHSSVSLNLDSWNRHTQALYKSFCHLTFLRALPSGVLNAKYLAFDTSNTTIQASWGVSNVSKFYNML